MTDSQARAMTDQPAAAPTPKALTCSICGKGGFASIGIGSKYEHDWTRCLTAERDRLETANIQLKSANEHWHTRVTQLKADVEALEAERDRLLVALEKIAQIQRDKCENASAEMLFMLLDNKVDIAFAALDLARQS